LLADKRRGMDSLARASTCSTVPGVPFVAVSWKVSIVGLGAVLTCALCVFFVAKAFGEGTYQLTKDGKTLIWNNEPKPGDTASWTGDRDRDGYASGFGTLTWYTAPRQSGDKLKPTVYARYFGNMIRGKFDGPVNGHSNRVTNHAIFQNGKRITRWAAGPVPSWIIKRPVPGVQERTIAATTESSRATTPSSANQIARSERPQPNYDTLQRQSKSTAGAEPPAEGPKPSEDMATITVHASPDLDHSLRYLTGPPPALRSSSSDESATTEAKTQPPAAPRMSNSRLSKAEVVELANAEARKRGYDPSEYEHSDPAYDPSDSTWSLALDKKAVQGAQQKHKHLSVAVDDETKKTAIVAGH
jgi:hypothetical protein